MVKITRAGEKRARQPSPPPPGETSQSPSKGGGFKRRKESEEHGALSSSSAAPQAIQACLAADEDGLPGPCLGSGPRWELRAACERSLAESQLKEVSDELRLLRNQGEGLLEQAFECSRHADVRFELDDGSRLVGAHRAPLCSASESFKGMFGSGMREEDLGVVRMRGVGICAVKSLMEWVYLGRPADQCKAVDGRELWLLAEMYDMQLPKQWLICQGIDDGNIGAVFEFASIAEGYRQELLGACCAFAARGLDRVSDAGLRGLRQETVKAMLDARMRGLPADAKGRRGVLDCFKFAERWFMCTGGWMRWAKEDVDDVMLSCDLGKLRNLELMEIVKPSGLVSAEMMLALYEQRLVNDNPFEMVYEVRKSFGKRGQGQSDFQCVGQLALKGVGACQVVAAVDSRRHRVLVFNVETGEIVQSVGSEGDGPGQFGSPLGVAYAPSGEMYVSDKSQHKIHIFDEDGKYKQSFGDLGVLEGQLIIPHGLAFTPRGDLVVADFGNNRVQIFTAGGVFIRSIGSGSFNCPIGVSCGDDGVIAVTDYGNARVQIYDEMGVLSRTIGSKGTGVGQFQTPYDICLASPGGEILVTDLTCGTIQIFTRNGEHLQTLGRTGKSPADFRVPQGVAVDVDGKVFVGCVYLHTVQLLDTKLPNYHKAIEAGGGIASTAGQEGGGSRKGVGL